MAIIDVVRFDGLKSRDWLIYKFPSESLVVGTQLIVQEGQIALFAHHGTVAEVFGPGTYTLSSENLPVLRRFVSIPFGGKTPFSAEIYFLNSTARLDITWGTLDPIQLIDPKYYVKLRVRAFGQMGLRVTNAPLVFKEIIGGMAKADIVKFDKVREYFRGILVIKVKSAIANAVITDGVSALEISTQLEKLSAQVKEQIVPEFAKFGFDITNFFIQSINFPEEDFDKINKILEDKAAFEIMGDGRYVTKRSFDVYEGAATNSNGVAGAFAAGGIGVGAALGMAQTMKADLNAMQSQSTTIQCKNCNAQIPANSKFCPECGFDYREKICECGNPIPAGAKFCINCGKAVK